MKGKAYEWKEKAEKAAQAGGSSRVNLEKLVKGVLRGKEAVQRLNHERVSRARLISSTGTGERGPILRGPVMLPGAHQCLLGVGRRTVPTPIVSPLRVAPLHNLHRARRNSNLTSLTDAWLEGGYSVVVWFREWKGCRADQYYWRVLLNRKLLQGYVTFVGKGDTKLVNKLSDSMSEWKLKFFYAQLPVFALAEELEACQWLVLIYLQVNNLHWFPSKETFFHWCQNSAYPDTPAVLVSSSSRAEKKKKRRGLKRPCPSVKEKLARKEVDPRTTVTPSLVTIHVARFDVSPSKAPTEPVHSRTMGFGPGDQPRRRVGPLPGFDIHGGARVFCNGGESQPSLDIHGGAQPHVCIKALADTFGEPSLSKIKDYSGKCRSRFAGAAGRKGSRSGRVDAARTSSAHRFGVSLNLGADECHKIIGAGKNPKETGVTQVFECLVTTLLAAMSEAHSRAEEELEASLELCYAEGVAVAERCFFYELQKMGQRANRTAALEVKAVDAVKVLSQDLYVVRLKQESLKKDMTGLLSNLATARAE
ncbi:hypothetical protein ACLOJK_013426 [Asimina triloba]